MAVLSSGKSRGDGNSSEVEQRELNVALQTPWGGGGFPGGPVVKNPPANAGDIGSIPGWGRPLSIPPATNPVRHSYCACLLEPREPQPLLYSLCRQARDTHDLPPQQGSPPPSLPPMPRYPACVFLPLDSSDRRITLQAQRSSDPGDQEGAGTQHKERVPWALCDRPPNSSLSL